MDEAFPLFRHDFRILLAHGAAQQVRFAHGESGQDVGNLHDLFLIDDYAQRLFQELLQFGQFVFDFSAAPLALNEIINHASLNRAGTVESIEGSQIFQGAWFIAAQHVSHAA